jgi:hypothetical protein
MEVLASLVFCLEFGFLPLCRESCRWRHYRACDSWDFSTIQVAAVDVKHSLLDIREKYT